MLEVSVATTVLSVSREVSVLVDVFHSGGFDAALSELEVLVVATGSSVF